MTNDTLERPIETVTDLVDFLLCAENDSFGCTYLRGHAFYLDGRRIDLRYASFMLILLKDDAEVFALIDQVSRTGGQAMNVALAQTVNKLVQIHQKNRHN